MSFVIYSEADHSAAAARLVSFAQSERALPVLRTLAPWLKTATGRETWFQLIALADDFLSAVISMPQYEHALLELAARMGMPEEDCEIVARYALEFCRCCFLGAGHSPIKDIRSYDDGGGK